MQPHAGSIRAFFKTASKSAGTKRASGGASAAATAVDAAQDALPAANKPAAAAEDPPPAVFARKRRRASAGSGAEPEAAATAAPASEAASPVGCPASGAQAAAAELGAAPAFRPRQLTQMYLDVGQRHFHSYRCPTCGMLYARGTDADERLHAAFHASATQGPRYQGWSGERVVQLDGSKGRVLLFGSTDQARPRKPLVELCGFLEDQMGLAKGWLLQAPLTVLLYVSAARRVQGFVAAEHVKEAFCVRPSLPPAAARGMLSCGSAVQPGSDSGAAYATGGANAPAAGQSPAAAAGEAHVANSGRSLFSMTLSTGATAAECSSNPAANNGGGLNAAEVEDGGGAEAEQRAQQAQQAHHPQQQAQTQQQAQHSAPTLPPLELDRSQRVRAVCGVRLMWVSVEARRRGLASRLLDCCRSHFMPGYVLPRHELAFSAPTDDGRAFIEQYAGSRTFLVYD